VFVFRFAVFLLNQNFQDLRILELPERIVYLTAEARRRKGFHWSNSPWEIKSGMGHRRLVACAEILYWQSHY
jgi:hypothetical protein